MVRSVSRTVRNGAFVALTAVTLGGCAGRETAEIVDPACDGAGDHPMYVVRSLMFARQTDGVSEGFDLDGVTTDLDGSTGCGIADLVDPNGAGGIDNAFAYLLPALELTEAAAVESLIQAAIESGALLIAIELGDVDDVVDDACVEMSVGRATGTPLIGTDGRLLSGQTFDPDPDVAPYIAEGAIVDGVIESPIALTLPVTIFDVDLVFDLRDGRSRATLPTEPGGALVGTLAGGIDVAYLLQVAQEENVDKGLHDIMEALLDAWADLAPDETGACTRISITFDFEAVPAFWYP